MRPVHPAHRAWIVPRWPVPANVRALVTTRSGGVSSGPYASLNLGGVRRNGGGDDPASVARNRAIVREGLPSDVVWLQQVHGVAVADLDSAAGETVADAAIARGANTVCAVLVADCMPVLLADGAGTMVGAAHAGWRGLSAGVIESTIAAMGSAPGQLIAYLGPCIGPAVYEVGSDVRDAFCAADANAGTAFVAKPKTAATIDKWLANLPMLARQRLARAGVERIFGGDDCTFSDSTRFFSYRRDGVTGNMAALIWREA